MIPRLWRFTRASERVLAGLDPEQRAAVTAPAGPVCILAGAGTGKTRAITHRIAHRVLTGEIAARHVLAVTFTARAAAEMRARLDRARGRRRAGPHVPRRGAAPAALLRARGCSPAGRMPELLESKARLVAPRRGPGRRARPTGPAPATWPARSSGPSRRWSSPADYAVAAAKALREPPHEPAKVAEVYAAYEQLKRRPGRDRLRGHAAGRGLGDRGAPRTSPSRSARSTGTSSSTSTRTSTRCSSGCCEAWLGGRDDLTVVGDASQTIYSFTGATSSYLVDFPRRHRRRRRWSGWSATTAPPRRWSALANAVIRQARGDEARLRLELVGQRPPGPEPELRIFADEPAEAAAVAAALPRADRRRHPGRARSPCCSGPTRSPRRTRRRWPRPACRTWCRAPSGSSSGPRCGRRWSRCAAATRSDRRARPRCRRRRRRRWPRSAGAPDAAAGGRRRPGAVGGAGRAGRARRGVRPHADGAARRAPVSLAEFVDELARRAAAQHAPTVDGVTLASLHSAKGLEWDAVFLVGLAEGTLPTTYAKTAEQVEEERRLLYVGVTRARQWLWLSYAVGPLAGRPAPAAVAGSCRARAASGGAGAGRRPPAAVGDRERRRTAVAVSCRVCGADAARRRRTASSAAARPARPTCDEELFERLREWRRGWPAAQRSRRTWSSPTRRWSRSPSGARPAEELVAIAGIGPRKLGLYGDAVLALVAGAAGRRCSAAEKTFETRRKFVCPRPVGEALASVHTSTSAAYDAAHAGSRPCRAREQAEGGGRWRSSTASSDRRRCAAACRSVRSGCPGAALRRRRDASGSAGAPGRGSGRADPSVHQRRRRKPRDQWLHGARAVDAAKAYGWTPAGSHLEEGRSRT